MTDVPKIAPRVAKVCPECGADLVGLDLKGHSLTHWPEYLDPAQASKEAFKRRDLLRKGGVTPSDFAALHGED